MTAITVDDEVWALKTLTKAVSNAEGITDVHDFSSCNSALEWARDNTFDIAFLDVNMRGMGGLELAKCLRQIKKDCKIIFCTGFKEYAFEAFSLHADGYLLKPITEEAVKEEMNHLFAKDSDNSLLTVRCFGGFEVTDKNGIKLPFKRSKTKELFALLVDKKGMGATSKEICAIMWEDDFENDKKNMQYLWNLFSDLTKTLKAVNAEDVLLHVGTTYSVDTTKIDCDYYDYLKGTLTNVDTSSYLSQYSWGEYTIASMQENI